MYRKIVCWYLAKLDVLKVHVVNGVLVDLYGKLVGEHTVRPMEQLWDAAS